MPLTNQLISKVLILTTLLVLSLFVMDCSTQQQDVASLLNLIKQQTADSSLTAEEIKKVYYEKRKNLETLRKTEVSLLAVEEAIRKYGSNNLLYKQRLEKLKEISAVKRVLQNEVASLMFLCEEKKCNTKPKEVAPTMAPLSTPFTHEQTIISMGHKRSTPPPPPVDEELEQIFEPSIDFSDLPDMPEPSIPEPSIPEPSIHEPSVPSIPEFGRGSKVPENWLSKENQLPSIPTSKKDATKKNGKSSKGTISKADKKPTKKPTAKPTKKKATTVSKISPAKKQTKETLKKDQNPKIVGKPLQTKSTETVPKKTGNVKPTSNKKPTVNKKPAAKPTKKK